MSTKRIAALSLVLLACGPKPKPSVTPLLPGDGDEHTAKPPVSNKKPIDDPWAGKPDMIKPPLAAKPAPVELPPIDNFKLGNGLEVFVIKSNKLPVVSMQVAIRAGRAQEPRSRLGVSEFAADLLVKGTTKRDADAIAKRVDSVGGTLATESTFEATLVSCSVLAKDQAMCLDLLPEVIMQPSFPDKERIAIRDKLVLGVRQRLDDAATLASLQVQNLLWGDDHVRGWVNSERTLDAVTRDDILAWHKNWFVPGNSILVVAGDVDGKKIKGDLERTFGAWKKGPTPPTPTFKELGLSGSRIRLVDKPGQTQTHIRIAQYGIAHDDPRFFDTLVWNYVLGGGAFSSRLMKSVRVEGGKTYGASSSFDRNLDRGSFVASSFTRNSEAITTTKIMINEIARMAKDGPTQPEVDAAIANIAGGYGLRFQSAADLGGALIGAELHKFGREYLANFPIAVGKVDQASAAKSAAQILDPRAFVLVLVGDAKDLEPLLKAEGWRYEKVAYTEPISPEIPDVVVPASAKDIAAMQKFLEEAIVAKGGRAKLTKLKGLKMTATGATAVQGKNVPVDIERIFLIPDKIRIDAKLTVPNGKVPVIVAVDGQTGWQLGPDPQTGKSTIVDIAKTELAAIEFEKWREPELILLKASDKTAKVNPVADETLDGKPQAVVVLASPFAGLDVKVYIDRKTKLVTRISYSDGPMTNTDDFADYRPEGGIQIAHKRQQSAGGRVTTLTVTKVELDPTVPASAFAKPAAPP